MGLYASDHPDVPGMQGLHRFHFMLSNCSQCVTRWSDSCSLRRPAYDQGALWTSPGPVDSQRPRYSAGVYGIGADPG
jgi:hypothetical protein